MKDYVICNFIPTYQEAPVSIDILDNQTSRIVEAVTALPADKKYVVLNPEDKRIQKYLQELNGIPNLTIIDRQEKDGFVFGNKTAVLKVISGEKPLPTGVDNELPIYSAEKLLCSEEKTVYIGGNAKKKGRYTFPRRVKPRTILEQCGSAKEFKGIYFGYPMGLMLGTGQLDDEIEVTTDYVIVFDETDCILDQLVKIQARYGKESCGRCVYGFEGVTQINMILTDMIQKKGRYEDVDLLFDLCNEMKTQALCNIGMAAATTMLTAFQNFRDEIEEHITKKNCKASVCAKYVTYHILPDLCTGCGECMDACEDEAILGKKRFIHVIDLDECIQCGACVPACEEGAIIRAGAIKPKGPKKPIPCK